jgi:hypothetical protein
MKRALRYLSCTSLIYFATINVLFQCIFNDCPKLYQNNKPPITQTDSLPTCVLSLPAVSLSAVSLSNPSNDKSGIVQFVFPQNTSAVIKLYNILGKSVRTLASGTFKPGNYQITLSKYNLPSGIYFVLVETPSGRHMKKVLIFNDSIVR